MFYSKKNSTIVEAQHFKTYDPIREGNTIVFKERVEDLNKGLKFTDFSVQSLVDADALDLLQPTAPISRDSLTVADIANSAATAIGNYSDSVSTNPKETEE